MRIPVLASILATWLMFSQQATVPYAQIRGTVVASGTAMPLPKTYLVLSSIQDGGPLVTTATDSAGKFQFVVSPGRYRLAAERRGYVRGEYGQRGLRTSAVDLTLAPGQEISELTITLTPTGVITGRFLDENREPIGNGQVVALRPRYQDGSVSLTVVRDAETNDLGEYRLFGLDPGLYYIQMRPPARPRVEGGMYMSPQGPTPDGRSSQFAPINIADAISRGVFEAAALEGRATPPIYYPGVIDIVSASPIALGPGEDLNLSDILLQTTRSLRVSGEVINSLANQNAAGASVRLYRRPVISGIPPVRQVVTANGHFDFVDLVPGPYVLISDIEKANVSTRLPLDLNDRDITSLRVPLRSAFDLLGRISVESKDRAPIDFTRVSIGLIARDGSSPGPRTQSLDDGSFVLKNVHEGDYRLVLSNIPPNWYIRSAVWGGMDVLESGLQPLDASSIPLEVVLSPNGAVVQCEVLDRGQHFVSNATVVAVPEHRQRFDLYQKASTNESGACRFQGLTPGRYKVFAWDFLEEGAWLDTRVLALYEDRGQSIAILEGDRRTVTLRLP